MAQGAAERTQSKSTRANLHAPVLLSRVAARCPGRALAAMKILVVDDSTMTRRMIASLVESLGHESIQAKDGLEGLVLLMGSADVDVILLDREMPNLDGIGFLERLGSSVENAPPVIVVSAHNDPELTMEALDAGASAFLSKPFDEEGLAEQLDAVTRERRNGA